MSTYDSTYNSTYGKLTLLYRTERRNKLNKRIYGMFQCECWNQKELVLTNVSQWMTTSCWCYKPQKTHWMHDSKIYWVYRSIIQRCDNPNNASYYNYGGRWIKNEWKSFENFIGDMLPTYQEWLTIDRLDNSWNYCKENCKWVTMSENQSNKRTNVLFQWKCLAHWWKENWIDRSLISKRIKAWWSIEDAATRIPNKHNKQVNINITS